MTSAERAEIEGKLDPMAEWYWSGGSSYWPLNRYGVIGVWALYQGDRNRINSAKNSYYSKLMSYLTTDGVFTSGSGYAWAGLSSNRDAKAYFMDVLEFTGEGTYYSDRKVRKFYEWLYRGASTHFYKNPTFGDSDPHRNVEGQWGEAAGYRAHRFSVQAAQNAAWMVNGVAPNARLLNYVLMDQPLPPAGKPLSGIWPDGCAAFWEDNTSSRSLMGVLWNWKSDYSGSHAHKDVNALHLAAYGVHVLRNSGYTGWGQGAYGFSWSYIHDTAVSGNTVHIDNLDHVRKDGGGILEGFTMPRFDYACGYSGNALSNGKHWRSFVFVHPQDDRNGYWVLFDEVDADNSSSSVNTALHPNSDDYSTVSDKLEYRWQIGPHTYSGHDVFLTIFLGTTPNTVELKDGLLAGFDGTDFVGKYLYATYDTDGNGKRNIVTVLFPHDGSHAKATIARVSGGGYTGVSIDLGGYIVDTALESSGTDVIAHSGVSFRGLASLYRRSSGNITFYFVREGRFFDDCTSLHRGFSSNSDVSVYMKDKQGKIISPGTDDVTFYYPGISAVLLGGVAAPVVESTAGWIKVTVASGTHELEFLTGGTVPLSAST